MSFELNKKVAFLNKLTGNTLTLTCYIDWELGSYGKDSLFCLEGLIGHVRASGFTECIDKAIKLIKGEVANG